MRKIPGVNTHIFKQPGLPWSVGFSPSDLANADRSLLSEWDVQKDNVIINSNYYSNLDSLNLDETDVRLGIFQNGSFPFDTLENNDINGFHAIGLTVSNFGCGLDSISIVKGEVYKYSFIVSNHSGGNITFSLKDNRASGATISTGLSIVEGVNEGFLAVKTTNATAYPSFYNDPSVVEFTISNFVLNKVEGEHFSQTVTAKQPALTDAETKDALVTFDGIDDFMSQPVNSGNFQDLTYAEIWMAVYVDQSNLMQLFYFSDDGGTINDRVFARVDAAGKLVIGSNNASATEDAIISDTALSVGWHICGFIYNGSSYSMIVDNAAHATSLATGTNTGKFVGGLTNKANIDIATIGTEQIATPTYSPVLFKQGIFIGGLSTAAATTALERNRIFNYINNRFDLGL